MPDESALSKVETISPVERIDTGRRPKPVESGIALCLSGGGYRAMLFHLGALWRLNEFGYLGKIKRISSVSGGSITAATLGMNWAKLDFDASGVGRRFVPEIVDTIRQLAGRTIDVAAALPGMAFPTSRQRKIVNAYRERLFGKATLQDLPDKPRFVINATNVQSGVLWRFMKPYMRDYRVGEIKNPTTDLATAVAASSACPPFLSPVRLKLDASAYTPRSGKDLQRKPFTTDVVLTDGGVYDNLGLETAWKRYDTILVSDGGGQMEADAKPKLDLARHTYRVLNMIDNQVRSLRNRQVVDSYKIGARKGAYWGIRANIADYHLPGALKCPFDKTTELADVKTRLARLDPKTQERLINWGYAICDAAMRRQVDKNLPAPDKFPYKIGVG